MKWLEPLGPFDAVVDVGGNLGDFAEASWRLWPHAKIASFEPVPPVAARNRERADGRWEVVDVALGRTWGYASINVCVNQHTASTMQKPGTVRRERFGIVDQFRPVVVETRPLDAFLNLALHGRLLVKIDVEGHEGQVIAGGKNTLRRAAAVVVEVQQDGGIFVGSPPPADVDRALRECGLEFAGVLASLPDPSGLVVQFDGLWTPAT